jgi:pimeloyl-ACP methyl ester carboxylesterase
MPVAKTHRLIGFLILPLACIHSPHVRDVSHPIAPPPDYADAVARVARRQAGDDSVVAQGGRSILLTHDRRTPRVFVLLHGFTNSPSQFQEVGERLFAATGDNVYIPRLPRHAEREAPVRALSRVRADELTMFADSVVDVARGLGDSVIVVGMSAGGAIAAWIAQWRAEVRRAVLIAPALGPGLLSEDQGRELVDIASIIPNITRTTKPDTARPDMVQGTTSRGLAEVLSLGHRVRDQANQFRVRVKDILFLLNERDHTVSERASLELAQRWFDHGAKVAVYKFPASAKLPHNVMEASGRGGNTEMVYPIVMALARGMAPPPPVALQSAPCRGFRCTMKRLLTS